MSTYKHYFIRHAHRSEFPLGDWGHDVSITEEGQRAAYQLGCSPTYSHVKTIWTSPIKRCVQTAEEIRRGIVINPFIYSSTLLGNPGFIILNPKLAAIAFQDCTLNKLMNLLLEGKPVPGFYSLEKGCKTILRELLKNKIETVLWISHDIMICLLACWIFGYKQSEEMMPDFLEGIEFTFREERIEAYFKGLRALIDETSLRGSCLS